jgi:hypothetical protein
LSGGGGGEADTVVGGAGGDVMDFTAAVEALLLRGGTSLAATSADVVICGGAFVAGSTNIRFTSGQELQIDIDGDGGIFEIGTDFEISLPGVTSVIYSAAIDTLLLA